MNVLNARKESPDPVYSNFDHQIDEVTVEWLTKHPDYWGQHAAFSFCGWVRYEPNGNYWVEEVWRHRSLIETLKDDSLEELINRANDKYGSE